ncbi:MAG TPA: OsmC family protein [Actinomycetota bacterium]
MDGNRHLRLTVLDEDTVEAVNGHGARLTIHRDGADGFTPLELLLAALGSCGAIDFAELMRKQRDPVTPFDVRVDGEKQDMRLTWLRTTYELGGKHDTGKVERARAKTDEDLCSVSRTLRAGTTVTHDVATR